MSEDDGNGQGRTVDADGPGSTDDPPVACTITDQRAEERAEWMLSVLLSRYSGAEERPNGVTVRFDGADETLRHVARFVAEEKRCCAFADYRIEVSPPYEETRLTITGPEGTREMFGEQFVARLEGEAPLEPSG